MTLENLHTIPLIIVSGYMVSKPILTLESELALIPLDNTYAINYLKNGGSTASLREQLGHRTIETVEKFYIGHQMIN